MGRGGSSGGGGGKGRSGGGGNPSLSAKEQSQVDGMRSVIAQKGNAARQVAQKKLDQLERTLGIVKKNLAENQQDIKIAPKSHRGQIARDIKSDRESISRLESQVKVIREALK